jgi:hypothetical protein
MQQFDYIVKRIKDAEFKTFPFKHLYIEDFLSEEHLNMLKESNQVKLLLQETTEDLIQTLKSQGYKQQTFPGCTTSVEEYLKWYNNQEIENLYNSEVVEGFGMAWRLMKIKSEKIQELINFLNSDEFHNLLRQKFNLIAETRVSTEIQKYLTGYEISPHPDIRSKALTYLININTENETEGMDIHTHLLSFKPNYSSVYNFWETNTNIDRCWVPWNWCNTEKLVSKNNSLVMFAPSNDTLHAVKLDYDHLLLQRTQLYGNLWYKKKVKARSAYYQDLPV